MTTQMDIKRSDKIKIFVLIGLYIFLIYNAIEKKWDVKKEIPQLRPNYEANCGIFEKYIDNCIKINKHKGDVNVICLKYKDLLAQCKSFTDIVITKANIICEPYLIKHDSCHRIRRQCTIEESNLNGCVTSIHTSVLNDMKGTVQKETEKEIDSMKDERTNEMVNMIEQGTEKNNYLQVAMDEKKENQKGEKKERRGVKFYRKFLRLTKWFSS